MVNESKGELTGLSIGDCNTASIKGEKSYYISNLKRNTKTLIKVIELEASEASNDKQNELMNEIDKDIRLTKLTFNGDDSKKKKSWMDMEIRYRRSRRLINLGAPSIIKQHELTWLYIMIHHFDLTLKGIKPRFSKEQLEELEALRRLEESI